MAILKKRTSSKQLPQAKALSRAPLSSVIGGVGNKPNVSSGGAGSITSGSTAPTAPNTSVTPSTSTPSTTPSTTPPLTSTTTPKSITTSPSTVARPTVTRPKQTSSTSSKVVNALTGAALGAGTKMLIDKFSSKPNVSKTPSQVAVENATVKASKAKDAAPVVSKKAPPVVTPPLTDKQIQAELDRVKASEEAFTPPEGAIKNADGTYSVVEDGMKITYNADGTTAGMEAAGEVLSDEEVLAELDRVKASEEPFTQEPQYFQDPDGNIYLLSADGGYDLYRAAEVDEFPQEETVAQEPSPQETTWTDPDTGDVWNLGAGGMWTLEGDTSVDNTFFADDQYDYDVNDRYSTIEDDGDQYYDYKRGGFVTLMKNGGLPRFANGNLVDETGMITDYAYSDEDGSLYKPLGRNEYNEYYLPVLGNQGQALSDASLQVLVYGPDGTVYGSPAQAHNAGVFNYTFTQPTSTPRAMANYYSTDESGNLLKNDQLYRAAEEPQDEYTTDSLGNTFKTLPDGTTVFYRAAEVPEDMTSTGGGTRPWYSDLGSQLGTAVKDFTGMSQETLDKITGALPAAGAGALVASLLGSDFGGSENLNQGLDMSKVGLINPRTTDFGIGPTRFVGYEDYGTGGGDYTPNEELLRNLNAPGFNPVNEGDYGYEEVPVEASAEAPKMASGGLSSMATPVSSYYTFGQPADILANLGMRAQPPMTPPEMMPQIGQQQQPQQTQQQGLPQQAPPQMAQQMPQGMPQQGMMPQQQGMPPPMRKGGLPHVSNVPMVEGRMDFRQGSAVHGAGDGQSDDIPAMLADGEYVIDSETVAQIGNGSTKAGAQALDKFRESIRAHKRSAPVDKIPPKTKALTSYLKGAR